jgi:hypothetical protein
VKASKLIKKLNRRTRITVKKTWGKGDRVENPGSGRTYKEECASRGGTLAFSIRGRNPNEYLCFEE